MNNLKKTQDYLNEVKGSSIRKGDTYTLSSKIGNFNKGDEVTINHVGRKGDEIELHISNSKGVKDIFYLDKNEEFEELD